MAISSRVSDDESAGAFKLLTFAVSTHSTRVKNFGISCLLLKPPHLIEINYIYANAITVLVLIGNHAELGPQIFKGVSKGPYTPLLRKFLSLFYLYEKGIR